MLDNTNKVRGFFKYTLRDAKTREILDHYEEENQIMASVPKMYFELVSGVESDDHTKYPPDVPTKLTGGDFQLCGIVLGDQGFDHNVGAPVPVDPEDKVINAMKREKSKFKGNAYQTTWKVLETTDHDTAGAARGVEIQTEGPLGPNGFISPQFNGKGMNLSNSLHSETGMDIMSDVRDGIITLQIEMLEKLEMELIGVKLRCMLDISKTQPLLFILPQ